MEPSSEIYKPWPLYIRAGWAAMAGCAISCVCGYFSHLAFLPAGLLGLSAAILFWFALRPPISLFATQFTVGKRAIAWQEIRAIDHALTSPLVLRLRLTNRRRKLLVFPGHPTRILKLVAHMRSRSFNASFDGIAYQDYHLWSKLTDAEAEQLGLEQPVAMISNEDEQEVERLYQKLKSVGHLDSSPSPDDTRSAK